MSTLMSHLNLENQDLAIQGPALKVTDRKVHVQESHNAIMLLKVSTKMQEVLFQTLLAQVNNQKKTGQKKVMQHFKFPFHVSVRLHPWKMIGFQKWYLKNKINQELQERMIPFCLKRRHRRRHNQGTEGKLKKQLEVNQQMKSLILILSTKVTIKLLEIWIFTRNSQK